MNNIFETLCGIVNKSSPQEKIYNPADGKLFCVAELNKVCMTLRSLLTPALYTLFEENCFFAGGTFYSLITKSKINDFDVFFNTEQAKNEFVTLYEKEYGRTHNSYKTQNAFTFKNGSLPAPVQFIHFQVGSPKEVISRFDFVHCQNYFVPKTQEIHFTSYIDTVHGYLMVNIDATYPLKGLERMGNFLKRGFTIEPYQCLLLAKLINQLDMSEENLKDQLRGMYSEDMLEDLKKDEHKFKAKSDKKYFEKLNKEIF
jgi:hypothetical protein